ncbi:hypothetical protein D3C81_1006410 [compost metagenome]
MRTSSKPFVGDHFKIVGSRCKNLFLSGKLCGRFTFGSWCYDFKITIIIRYNQFDILRVLFQVIRKGKWYCIKISVFFFTLCMREYFVYLLFVRMLSVKTKFIIDNTKDKPTSAYTYGKSQYIQKSKKTMSPELSKNQFHITHYNSVLLGLFFLMSLYSSLKLSTGFARAALTD